jgi:hypothetical protein
MPNDVYTEYTMRSEHALFVELKDGMDTYNTANLAIEDKLWYTWFTIIIRSRLSYSIGGGPWSHEN